MVSGGSNSATFTEVVVNFIMSKPMRLFMFIKSLMIWVAPAAVGIESKTSSTKVDLVAVSKALGIEALCSSAFCRVAHVAHAGLHTRPGRWPLNWKNRRLRKDCSFHRSL